VPYFKVMSQIALKKEKNHENRAAHLQACILTEVLTNTKSEWRGLYCDALWYMINQSPIPGQCAPIKWQWGSFRSHILRLTLASHHPTHTSQASIVVREKCYRPDQPVHYHSLDLWGFATDPNFGRLKSKVKVENLCS
jgi:hypothetical protein